MRFRNLAASWRTTGSRRGSQVGRRLENVGAQEALFQQVSLAAQRGLHQVAKEARRALGTTESLACQDCVERRSHLIRGDFPMLLTRL